MNYLSPSECPICHEAVEISVRYYYGGVFRNERYATVKVGCLGDCQGTRISVAGHTWSAIDRAIEKALHEWELAVEQLPESRTA